MSTSLTFAFRAGKESDLILFGLAVGVTAVLVVLERLALWLLNRSAGRLTASVNPGGRAGQ